MNQIDTTPRHRVFQAGAIRYDEALRELHIGGRRRSIEAKPLAVLHTLMVHAGATVTKRELIEAAWGNADHIAETSLTTAISKLRAVLREAGKGLIEVVPGSGYRIGVSVDVTTVQARPRQHFSPSPQERVPGRPHWRLERLLSDGGGRHAWLARHGKTGEARVFKFATTLAELETLRQEADLSRILHATLGPRDDFVRILDWDFDHPPYFIESAYGGPPLTEWAAQGKALAALDLAARLGLIAGIARTVAAAHAAGVLHGDIKPANIVVADANAAAPMLRMIDFGAGGLSEPARLGALQIALTAPLASMNPRAGTVGYIPPEVLAGAAVTTAADIYALGVLAWQIAAGDLTRMPGVGWQDGIADPLLREDIASATAADPARRLQSAAGFAERLESLTARHAAQAVREGERRQAALLRRRAERARLRRPWIIAAVLCLIAALIVSRISATRAALDRDEARRRAETAQAVDDFLTLDLLGRGDPAQSGKPDESLMDAAQAAEAGIDRRLSHEPRIAGSLYLALARAFDSRSAFDAARHAYDQAAAAFEEAGDPADAVITRLRQVIMETVSGQAGSMERAGALLGSAEPHLAALGARRDEAATWLIAARSLLQMYRGDMEAAQAGFETAVARADARPDIFDKATRLSLRRRLDFTYARMGQWGPAADLLKGVLQSELALNGPRHPDTLHVELNLVEVLLGAGNAAQAVETADRLQPVFISVLGPDNRLTLDLLSNRAEALLKLGRYDDALRDEMAVYQANVAKYGPNSPKPFWILTYAAQTQCRAGQVDAGLASARAAYGALHGEPGDMSGAVASNMAFCLLAAKDYAGAGVYLDQIHPVSAAQSRRDPEYPALIGLMRADVAFARGDIAEAERQMAGAAPVFERPGADLNLQRWARRLQKTSGPVLP
jgi:DNA-binding winged helix-turn-helix (wHTH) protein/tetratricopeptide (TPR) repeat protein